MRGLRPRAFIFLCSLAVTGQTLTVTPVSLSFTYQLGAATLPATQNLTIGGTINQNFTLAVTGAPSNGAWLLVSALSGKTNATLKVQVNPTGLVAGSYSATITITGSGTTPPVSVVPVSLVVGTPAPSLTVSASSFSISYTTGTSTTSPSLTRALILSSSGSAIGTTLAVQGAPWLKASPTGSIAVSGLFNPITLTADPTGLTPRVYTGTVRLSTPTASVKQTDIPVTLTVNAAPPSATGLWPSGLAQQSPSSVVSLLGSQLFSNSTAAATGFSPNVYVTVTDSAAATDTRVFNIPVYSNAASVTRLRVNMASPLPPASTAAVYALGLSAAGGTAPYTWSLSGTPPAGLGVLGSILAGTPAAAGTYRFNLAVTDSTTPVPLTAWQPVELNVYGASPPLRITVGSGALPTGVAGVSWGPVTLTASGGTAPYSWAAVGLPAGMTLSASGVLSGTPSTAGSTGAMTAAYVSNNALLVTAPSSLLTAEGFLRIAATTPTPGGGTSNEAHLEIFGPSPRVAAVVNSASLVQGVVAPGELVSIYGDGLGPATPVIFDPNTPPIPTALSGTSVTIGGVPAPVLYASSTQLTCIVPYSVTGSTAPFVVTYNGLSSQSFPITLAATDPAIYTTNGSGRGQGAILNYDSVTGDYALNSQATAAPRGSIVVLYATGAGAMSSAVSNQLIPSSPSVTPNATVNVTIGGIAATVISAVAPVGSVPGLLQVNLTVPATAPIGPAVPVVLNIGGVDSPAGITMAVR